MIFPHTHKFEKYYVAAIQARRLNYDQFGNVYRTKDKTNKRAHGQSQRVDVGPLLYGLGAAIKNHGTLAPPNGPIDIDWDGFYDGHRDFVWCCKGTQTGKFASNANCRFDYQG